MKSGFEGAPRDSNGQNAEHGTAMWIYWRVRADILSGVLSPGQRVSQVQLAASLGVGRPTLREALRMLQNEGLVRAEHNRQMVIAPLDAKDFEQLGALRLAIEPMAIERSVPQLTDTDLAEIIAAEAETSRLQKQLDFVKAEEAHQRFHFLLFSRAGDRIRRQCEEMWQLASRYRQLMVGSELNVQAIAQLSAADHASILHAALAHDGEGCAERIAGHISKVNVIAVALIDAVPPPRMLRTSSSRADNAS